MSFAKWKKKFSKDMICVNQNELNYWLSQHSANNLICDNKKNICKQINNKLYIISYFLELTVQDLSKKYKYNIYSLETIKNIIYEEYFKIFGNLCKIIEYQTRVMEYPTKENCKEIYIQKVTIFAKVQQIWKEERASIKINRFFWNNYYNKFLTIPETKIKNFNKLPKTFSYSELAIWTSDDYHEKIVEYFVLNKPKNVKQPRLVLIIGLPGSGKNWVLKKRRKKNHVMINMDDCRALLPKYWKTMITKASGDWIKLFHDECACITRKIFKYAIKHRMHIVWNGTGKNLKKYLSLITTAKKNGYIIEVKYIWVPLNLAKARVKKRMIETGRNVPDSIIKKASEKIPHTFNNILVQTNYARIYENESKSPKMIWDKFQGWDENYISKKSQIFKK